MLRPDKPILFSPEHRWQTTASAYPYLLRRYISLDKVAEMVVFVVVSLLISDNGGLLG